jgi:hypothetical protein
LPALALLLLLIRPSGVRGVGGTLSQYANVAGPGPAASDSDLASAGAATAIIESLITSIPALIPALEAIVIRGCAIARARGLL